MPEAPRKLSYSAKKNLTERLHRSRGNIEDTDEFIAKLNRELSVRLNINPLSKEQLQAPVEFAKLMESFGVKATNDINRKGMTTNYLAVWAFSNSLL